MQTRGPADTPPSSKATFPPQLLVRGAQTLRTLRPAACAVGGFPLTAQSPIANTWTRTWRCGKLPMQCPELEAELCEPHRASCPSLASTRPPTTWRSRPIRAMSKTHIDYHCQLEGNPKTPCPAGTEDNGNSHTNESKSSGSLLEAGIAECSRWIQAKRHCVFASSFRGQSGLAVQNLYPEVTARWPTSICLSILLPSPVMLNRPRPHNHAEGAQAT